MGDVAVMYRTTAQSRVLEEAFRQSDVRYRIVGGVRFYERAEVKNALAALRLLYNPADQVSLQRVLDTMPIGRGLGPKALEAIEDWARPHRPARARWFHGAQHAGFRVRFAAAVGRDRDQPRPGSARRSPTCASK